MLNNCFIPGSICVDEVLFTAQQGISLHISISNCVEEDLSFYSYSYRGGCRSAGQESVQLNMTYPYITLLLSVLKKICLFTATHIEGDVEVQGKSPYSSTWHIPT